MVTRPWDSDFDVGLEHSDVMRKEVIALMRRQLSRPSYGLIDASCLDHLVDPLQTRFLVARKRGSSALAGAFRLTRGYEPLKHGNINSPFTDYLGRRPGVVDVGAYFVESGRARVACFIALFRGLIRLMRTEGDDCIYIQVRLHEVNKYQSIGFMSCTCSFRVHGWATAWMAMLLSIGAVECALDPNGRIRPGIQLPLDPNRLNQWLVSTTFREPGMS